MRSKRIMDSGIMKNSVPQNITRKPYKTMLLPSEQTPRRNPTIQPQNQNQNSL